MFELFAGLTFPKFSATLLAILVVIATIVWPIWSVMLAFLSQTDVRRTSLTIGFTKITFEKTTRKVGG